MAHALLLSPGGTLVPWPTGTGVGTNRNEQKAGMLEQVRIQGRGNYYWDQDKEGAALP